jgi:asparagine synthase (glutamine-hydrolysing)
VRTFSIRFPGYDGDESPYSRQAAELFGTRHQEFDFRPNRIEECLCSVAGIFDQPLADSAVLPLLLLSEKASAEVKVVLTGDGGDELFGGYRKYRRAATSLGSSRLVPQLAGGLFQTRHLAACAPDPLGLKKVRTRLGMVLLPTQRSSYHRLYWEGWDRHRLYQKQVADDVMGDFAVVEPEKTGDVRALESVNLMLRMDQSHYLPGDLLLKTDYATMAHGLEARAPLLDHQLAKVAGQLPVHLKVTPRETKAALRRVAERWLPAQLANRPKKGFSFPIKNWFRYELRDWVRNCLLETSTTVPQYFQHEHVERVISEHMNGKRDHAGRIYCLLTFELWHRTFMG